jgi:MerR family copper efflux transcriptional regulator
LGRLFGVAAHVLRHWEAVGVLTSPIRKNGRRLYDEPHVRRVAMIICAQEAGLGLTDLREVLEAPTVSARRTRLEQHQATLARRIVALEESQRIVEQMLDWSRDDFSACPVFERTLAIIRSRADAEHQSIRTRAIDHVTERKGLRRKIPSVSHPLVLALCSNTSVAAEAAAALHALGISKEHISVVAHSHADGRILAERLDATSGVDLEESRPAAVLGELSGRVIAMIALVMPGIGPIVAAGPLAAELGEAAGQVAGSLASVLESAGLPQERAEALQREVSQGAVLLGVHVAPPDVDRVRDSLAAVGATRLETVNWP